MNEIDKISNHRVNPHVAPVAKKEPNTHMKTILHDQVKIMPGLISSALLGILVSCVVLTLLFAAIRWAVNQ